MLTIDDYIKVFREECGEHLAEHEVKELEPLFSAKEARFIFVKLEELRTSGHVPSPRFEKALLDFFWRFVY
jgi:hypothetical protein